MTDDMTTTATTKGSADAFAKALTALAGMLEGQVLVSQDRCVDGFLDLFNAAPNELVRRLVGEAIDDVRHVRTIRSEDVRATLAELSAAMVVETTLD